jgi:hypothetical protein
MAYVRVATALVEEKSAASKSAASTSSRHWHGRSNRPAYSRLLTVYFGTPSMFIILWFGFDYETNPPLGTLII